MAQKVGFQGVNSIELVTTTSKSNAVVVPNTAGTRLTVTQVQVTCSANNSVNPQCRVGLGVSSIAPNSAGVIASHGGIPPGGGMSRGDGDGILADGLDAQQVLLTCDAPTGGDLRVVVSYFVRQPGQYAQP